MIKLSKMSDHALLLCSHLSARAQQSLSAGQWAQLSLVPEPTATKILKALCAAGICESRRGKGGGYRLAVPAHSVSFLAVVEAVDGPILFSDCALGALGCARMDACAASPHVVRIGQAIKASMSGLTIDMIASKSSIRSTQREAIHGQ